MLQLCVLIAEDNEDNAFSLAALLRLHGHQRVRVVSDGESALAAAESGAFDVVLIDIALPGMNGWEAARRLRALKLDKRPLLVAVTGYGRDEDRQRSVDAGIDYHLVKPADPRMLLDLLEAHASGLHDGAAPSSKVGGIA